MIPHDLIPGGAHTYSKGDDQFPANAPRFIERGDGARVWDDQGNEYLDWTASLRAISLGHGYGPVVDAAVAQIAKGSNFARPSMIETELAGDLIELFTAMEMVKFAKNGSTVTTAAVKLARAFTGRDKVAICKDHPFFSYDDWFIGATVCDSGIPQPTKELTVSFRYNDLASAERLFQDHPGEIAAVILEPATVEPPRNGFLAKLKALCHENGALFVLDEMITGFRFGLRGGQGLFDVTPDLCTFGKGMGNGFSTAALLGRRDIMELGGLHHDKKRVFLISTTHGAENHSLAATRATIGVFREHDVSGHMHRIGEALARGMDQIALDLGLADCFKTYGFACNPYYEVKDADGEPSLPFRTLFNQEMIRSGILMPYIAPTFAHTEADVSRTLEAVKTSLGVVSRALEDGWQRHLEGPPVKPVFRAYN